MLDKNIIKVSSIWSQAIEESIVFHILKKISKKRIVISNPSNADILFVGPYNKNTVLEKSINHIKKIKYLNKLLPNIDVLNFKRQYKPIKIFFSHEGYFGSYNFDEDFHINCLFGLNQDNHLRTPIWKDFIDWRSDGIIRDHRHINGRRFGKLYDVNQLLKPQGYEFLKKENKACIISSHLNFPRDILYKKLKAIIDIDGFGKFFNPKIKNHNESNFIKIDILKKYRFNLCPHNFLIPGYYDEKITDAYYCKTLPITWCDDNVNEDFNTNCFINMNEYMNKDIGELKELLSDEAKLKKFGDEPLIKKKPNLENEFNFMKKILDNF